MAVVKAGLSPLRMDELGLAREGNPTFTPTNVRLTYEEGWFTDFGGQYSYSQAGIAGTTTAISETKAGKVLYSVTGANADADTLFDLIDAGNVLGAAAYVLRDRDEITGGPRDDRLFGFGGNDTIQAGIGQDVIVGGAGSDKLSGGASGDFFTYLAVSDSGIGKVRRDRIADFDRAEGDKIDLSAIDAIVGNDNPNDAFNFVRRGTGVAGQAWVQQTKLGFLVMADTDGGGADFSILVTSDIAPIKADFIL